MLDRKTNDEDQRLKEESFDQTLLDAVKNLKSVSILLKGLYSEINEEREVTPLAAGQIAHATQQFENHLARFEIFQKSCQEKLDERIHAQLNHSIRDTAYQIAKAVETQTYEPIQNHLKALSQISEHITRQYNEEKRTRRWLKIVLIASLFFIGGICGFSTYYFSPETRENKIKQAAGNVLIRSWDHLSKLEQDKIMALGK